MHYGKITSYHSGKGIGKITPEGGGEALHFAKSDLQLDGRQPQVSQRYGYQTSQIDGGKPHAINLQMVPG